MHVVARGLRWFVLREGILEEALALASVGATMNAVCFSIGSADL